MHRFIQAWLSLGSRNYRVFLLDAFLLAFAVYLGFALRLTLLVGLAFREDMLLTVLLFVPCISLSFYLGGVYRIFWPQASVEEYARLSRLYVFGFTAFLIINFFWKGLVVPRTSLAIMLFSGLFFLGGVRASWRLAKVSEREQNLPSKKTLIIGAGEAGAYLARDLIRKDTGLRPVGFIDEDPMKTHTTIAGLSVLGGDRELADIIKQQEVEVALLALPAASGARIRHYLDVLTPLHVEVRVLPSLRDLAGGQVEISRMRSVSLEDLLRREPIHLDMENISSLIQGKRILITGAGGSIGSEICRQLLPHSPAELITLGHGEQSLYQLTQALRNEGNHIPQIPVVADIADEAGMRDIFNRYRPEVIFHAAAHKHVPLMEINPRESLRVNALGTWTLSQLAGEFEVQRLVMISSDKAVNPSSVMGATKRIAERLLRQTQEEYPKTSYMAVRFGNVLGSRGSVVPLFEEQIKRGGPVTVTHRDMKRYFMLIPEAVSLVLQAGSMGRGGELYVLDMGEPVNITEMAQTLIRLHGYEPDTDIPIVFSGIRPGEKLYEELFYDPGHVEHTGHDKIYLTRLDGEQTQLITKVQELLNKSAAGAVTIEELRLQLFEMALR